MDQISLFDSLSGSEPEIGEYVSEHGAVIPHIMRKGFIGKRVIIDVSTRSREWYLCGLMESYLPYEGKMRAIVFTGEKQRQLITFYPGVNIYELKGARA